jgi:hypothetical protein
VRRRALTQRSVTTNRGCYSLRFFGSFSNSMSRAFSFEEKHSGGTDPTGKRETAVIIVRVTNNTLTIAHGHRHTTRPSRTVVSHTTHPGALSDHHTPRVETTNAHPTRWTVDPTSKANIKARCRTSHLVRCFEVGASGSKNLNRFRFVIHRGQVERSSAVLRKREIKGDW